MIADILLTVGTLMAGLMLCRIYVGNCDTSPFPNIVQINKPVAVFGIIMIMCFDLSLVAIIWGAER